MISRFKLAAVLSLSLCGVGSAYAAGDPTGTYLTEDGRAKVKVELCGADHKEICGNVVWLKDPLDEKGHPRTDIKNPDPAKRSRSTVGMPLFENLKLNDDEVYAGQIYNAENGKMYDVTVKLDDDKQLKIHGCMLAVLCGSQEWKHVADVAPAATLASNSQAKPAVAAKKPKAAPAAAAPAAPAQ